MESSHNCSLAELTRKGFIDKRITDFNILMFDIVFIIKTTYFTIYSDDNSMKLSKCRNNM